MSHEIKYRQMDIPELDAFIGEYHDLCKKHGVQFVSEEYGYDGGSYMTIEPYSGGSFYLNLDQAGGNIPFLERVREEADRLNKLKYAAQREAEKTARKAVLEATEKLAVENGVVLGGKRYKLTPAP